MTSSLYRIGTYAARVAYIDSQLAARSDLQSTRTRIDATGEDDSITAEVRKKDLGVGRRCE